MPIEAAISRALLADELQDVCDLAIATIAKMPPSRVGEFLLSPEVQTILTFSENGKDRHLLAALESADPETVARYLVGETDPEGKDIAQFLDASAEVIPTESSGRRAYWWMMSRLIWGMQWGDRDLMPRLIEGLRVFNPAQG